MGTAFENVQMNPVPPLLDATTPIFPAQPHPCSGSGYIRGTYRGLTTELYRPADGSQRVSAEETGLWEKNEQEVYTGQWMLCQLNREFPTWLTIWPRDRLDKLFSSKTIQTGNEGFDKRFNLSSDDEAAALRILSPGRMERILALADSSIGKFAGISTRMAGCISRFTADTASLISAKAMRIRRSCRSFAREPKWFTDMIDAFRDVKGGGQYASFARGAAGTVAVGDFSPRRYLRKPLQSVCVILCVLLAAACAALYRTDPSVCGCGTEPAAGIVKRSPAHSGRKENI